MKLRHFFLVLLLGILLLAASALYAAFGSHPRLFLCLEVFCCLLILYLWMFYRRTLRPFDTLTSGVELVRDLDLTTRLAPTGQHETDVIVHAFNGLLTRLRSEHLRLEEQYTFLSLLIEASPTGIVRCDLDGNPTTMNPAARSMMSPDVERTIRSLPLDETATVRLSGEPKLLRVSHLSFPDRGFRRSFFLIDSLTDEVHRAERAAYERIVRMMAHEVNNTATALMGSLSGGEAERLKALSAFVTRTSEVVKLPQPQLLLCDLSEEVEACRPFLESLCTVQGVRLELHLTDEALPVRLDSVLFQQVLINIVKNAVESIGTRGGRIVIESSLAERVGGGGAAPILVVCDDGRGISPEVGSQLFTPFFSTKPQGQGIGLLLIRDILTAHGCSFSLLTSPEDHLTRFTIRFP